jgi:hypothetical protein
MCGGGKEQSAVEVERYISTGRGGNKSCVTDEQQYDNLERKLGPLSRSVCPFVGPIPLSLSPFCQTTLALFRRSFHRRGRSNVLFVLIR